jgi:pyruvate dehydrogenase E1 component beta subunit
MIKTNNLTISEALDDALLQAMDLDPSVIAFGPGVGTSSQIFGTTKAAFIKYGSSRVFDTPVSEQALTQMAAGAALSGMRPILIHQRFDFMLYSLDAIYNWIALWRYKSAGKSSMPLVIRAIVGKGWGQGPQHAKNMPSIFAHCPGLRVVTPSNPTDAKGLMIASIFSNDPVIFIEERSLHSMKGPVPEGIYFSDLDKSELVAEG